MIAAMMILALLSSPAIFSEYLQGNHTNDGTNNQYNRDAFRTPDSAMYNTVSNNGTRLNVTGIPSGNSSSYGRYIDDSGGYIYQQAIPQDGILTNINFTIKDPEIINQSTLVVNDTLDKRPAYTITYEDEELIKENATSTIVAESWDVHPLGNISVFVNSSVIEGPVFYKNFTDGEGSYSFNVSRSTIGDLNVSVYFFYENETSYSFESYIVSFTGFANTTILSPEYSIDYTPRIYPNQTGNVYLYLADGTTTFIGDINATWDGRQRWAFNGDGSHSFSFKNESAGLYEINIEIYLTNDRLYANESFMIEVKEPETQSIEKYSYGNLYYNITYEINAKATFNASITIKTINTADYLHGDINVTVKDGEAEYNNQSGEVDYQFNVWNDLTGPVTVNVTFYNDTDDLNSSEEFTINFFSNFDLSSVDGILYEIKYPATCYTGFNGTIYVNATDGTNLTIGNSGIYYNDLLNWTFPNAGVYENNITRRTNGFETVKIEYNYTGGDWFRNETFVISFVTKPTQAGTPIIRNDPPLSGYNRTRLEGQNCEAMSMQFTTDKPLNITSLSLFSAYSGLLIQNQLILELRENNYAGTLVNSQLYNLANSLTADWHTFSFETGLLDPGTYCVVLNGTKFSDNQFGTDAQFDWYFAHGSGSTHNAKAKRFNGPWTDSEKDYLLRVGYEDWIDASFDDVSINVSKGSDQMEMIQFSADTAYVNISDSWGSFMPDSGNHVEFVLEPNRSCRVDLFTNITANVTQQTEYSSYKILDTDGVDPVEWNVTVPGSTNSIFNIDGLDIYDYQSTLFVPLSWKDVNGTTTGHSEEYSDDKLICFNQSVASMDWEILAFSDPTDSTIEILQIMNIPGNVMARGENVTVRGSVSFNNNLYYANLSIWRNGGLNFTTDLRGAGTQFTFENWTIPDQANPGEYKAYYYWSNGSDVAMNSINFTIKLRASFDSVNEYGEMYLGQNATFDFLYEDYFTESPITNGHVTTNWTEGQWFVTDQGNGNYSIEFNNTGYEKGIRLDVNISVSSEFYKNISILFPVYILVETSLVMDPNFNEYFPYVNESLFFTIRLDSIWDVFGVSNSSGAMSISADIDGIEMPLYITEYNKPENNYFSAIVNLSDFDVYPQIGEYILSFHVSFKNETIHYESQTNIIDLFIEAQRTFFTIDRTSAFNDGDLTQIYDYIGQSSLSIYANLSRWECQCGEHIETKYSNASILATMDGSTLDSVRNYVLSSIDEGYYKLNIDISDLDPNTQYEINITVKEPDLQNLSVSIQFNLIERMETIVDFNSIPKTIAENRKIPISGNVYVINNSKQEPLVNYRIKITVTFFGTAGTEKKDYYLVTSSTGSFSLNNITSPDSDEYISALIQVTVAEGRYNSAVEFSAAANIGNPLFWVIILVILGSIVGGGFAVFFLYRYWQRRRLGEQLRPWESLIPKSKKAQRDELKSKLQNYIRVPELEMDGESLTKPPKQVGDGYKTIVVPESADEETLEIQRKMKLMSDDLVFGKDALALDKEKFLNAAIKQQKAGNYIKAAEYYEKAALLSEKLGLFNESMVYFEKFEKLHQIVESQKSKNPLEKLADFVNERILRRGDESLMDEMKDRAESMKSELYPRPVDDVVSDDVVEKIAEERQEKNKKKKEMKKNSKVLIPKDVSIPLVKKSKYKEHVDYRKAFDDL